jgi:hypothetical protein
LVKFLARCTKGVLIWTVGSIKFLSNHVIAAPALPIRAPPSQLRKPAVWRASDFAKLRKRYVGIA